MMKNKGFDENDDYKISRVKTCIITKIADKNIETTLPVNLYAIAVAALERADLDFLRQLNAMVKVDVMGNNLLYIATNPCYDENEMKFAITKYFDGKDYNRPFVPYSPEAMTKQNMENIATLLKQALDPDKRKRKPGDDFHVT